MYDARFFPGETMMDALVDAVRWNADGLVPAIAQDAVTGDVLMLAWMNRESLALTVEKRQAVYWSRSRSALWRKGERSGHRQLLRELRLDCDGDTILLKVEQIGGIACHSGRKHCFFQRFEEQAWCTVEPVVKPPETIYGQNGV